MSETMANLKKAGGGKKAVLKTINLGTGTSINIKNHEVLGPIYDQLTINNFYQKISGNSGSRNGNGKSMQTLRSQFTAPSLSYNASTGVLSSGNATALARANVDPYGENYDQSITCTTTAYCVYVDYE